MHTLASRLDPTVGAWESTLLVLVQQTHRHTSREAADVHQTSLYVALEVLRPSHGSTGGPSGSLGAKGWKESTSEKWFQMGWSVRQGSDSLRQVICLADI